MVWPPVGSNDEKIKNTQDKSQDADSSGSNPVASTQNIQSGVYTHRGDPLNFDAN